jgi:hypothetical protein
MSENKTRIRKPVLIVALCAAAVLLFGIGAYAYDSIAGAPPGGEPEFRIVGEAEYEAIQAGEIDLNDGVPRVWSNPSAAESVRISKRAEAQ